MPKPIQKSPDKANVREAIANHLNALSDLERKIADYTLANYREAAMLSIGELAGACGVSNTTINRYARNLGYDGYHEYRRTLRDEISEKTSLTLLKGMVRQGGSTEILNISLKEDSRLIDGLSDGIDAAAFEDTVARILSARRVFVLGNGSSAYLAGYLAFNLLGLGIDAQEFGDQSGVEGAARRALQITDKDLMIAIAFPRFSSLTIDFVTTAKETGCHIIAITSSLSGPLAHNSDAVLFAPPRRDLHSGSGVPAMALIEAIITAVTASAKSAEDAASRLSTLIDHHLL
ncbi:MurR/RpiR family transcriptional regulator [Hyphococcus luteus]|nr:MurR/RpiR family transcriptional regulator [Marinicaulis flavus]